MNFQIVFKKKLLYFSSLIFYNDKNNITGESIMSAYLFPHFTETNEDKESVWFAISCDGLNWTDLGSDEPLLYSSVGTTGIRDPFVLYDEKRKKTSNFI